MREDECAAFLQWALPRLRLRWAGFRKVRSQVCKRLQRRMDELRLEHSSSIEVGSRRPRTSGPYSTISAISPSRAYIATSACSISWVE